MMLLTAIILVLTLVPTDAGGFHTDCVSNCKTCYSEPMTWMCMSCYEGAFLRRFGQYYKCEDCDPGCVSCQYYGDCDKCKPGRYGQGCEHHCATGCVNGTCEQMTGQCDCRANFTGLKCDTCVEGKHGVDSNCTLTCPANCISCVSEQQCIKCKPGYYGTDCQLACPNNCLHGNCSKVHGYCYNLDCTTGYRGARCDYCQHEGKYGTNCTLNCIQNCDRCNTGTTCDKCSTGYWGTTCLNPCPASCLGNLCNMFDGSGPFSLKSSHQFMLNVRPKL